MDKLVQAIENNFNGIEKGNLFNTGNGQMIAKTTLSGGSIVYDFGQYIDGKANSLSLNSDGGNVRIVTNNFD